MAEKIEVHVPRQGIGDALTRALGERGLDAKLVEADDRCALEVSFAEPEHDRLVTEVTHVIEAWLSEQDLPLVVQRANGGAVVRPPGD